MVRSQWGRYNLPRYIYLSVYMCTMPFFGRSLSKQNPGGSAFDTFFKHQGLDHGDSILVHCFCWSATCHACSPAQIKNRILRDSRYELLYCTWMGQHGQHTLKSKIPLGLSSSVQKFYCKPTWPHPWKIFSKIIFASRRRILVSSTPRGSYM